MFDEWHRRRGTLSTNVVYVVSCRGLRGAIFIFIYLISLAQAPTFAQLVDTTASPPRWGPLVRRSAKANFLRPSFKRDLVPAATAFPESRSFPSPGMLPEEQLLLSLMEQENVLLQDYGPDYFQVRNVRARIKAAEEFISRKNVQRAINPPPASQPPAPTNSSFLGNPKTPMPKEQTPRVAVRVVPLPPESEEEEPEPVRGAPSKTTKKRQAAPREIEEAQQAPAIESSFWPLTLLSVFAILAGLLLGLLIHFFVVLWLIRHLGGNLSPLHRTARVSAPAESTGQAWANRPADVRSAPESSAASVPGQISRTEPRDLPPTYEDVRNQRKNETEHREDAMLRQVYEQNIRLREQIGQLITVTA